MLSPGRDEERVDEVVQVEPRLADERPERRRAPEAAQTGGGKRRHAGIFARDRRRRGRLGAGLSLAAEAGRGVPGASPSALLARCPHGEARRKASDAGGVRLLRPGALTPLRSEGTSSTLGRRRGLGLPDVRRAGARARPLRAPRRRPSARKERPFRLKALASFVTVPRMADPRAPGFAARARQRQREEAQAKARRARAPRRSSSLPAAASSHYS